MVSDITFSTAIIKDSITNSLSDKSIAKDNTKPFSFLDFIMNTNVEYSPDEYNKFYIYYLQEWSTAANTRFNTTTEFVNLYVEFLKELTLTYSTQQELHFLKTLDYTDPVDLDIAIPFFAEKIRQIVLFFKEKREKGKYAVDRNKIKGTQLSVERSLYEKIYNYVVSAEDDPNYTTLNYSLSNIVNNLNIDIHEYVDVYSNYFDLPRTNVNEEGLRREFYTSNLNDIDYTVYFDNTDIIFSSKVFLTEIPLAVNTALEYDVTCDPLNPLALKDQNCINLCGFNTEDRLALQQKLLEKYIGVDIYYIDTTTSPYTSGVLVKAEKPFANVQNLQTADVAAVQSNSQRLLRDVGIFFKPDRFGLFKLNASNYTYSVDNTKLSAGSVYLFPDPNVYSNVSINSQNNYPLVFEYNFKPDVRSASSGFAIGDPKVLNDEQNFTPYYTREQNELKNLATDNSILLNFGDLYNSGYITKYQTDVFGNEYALLKDKFGQTFKTVTEAPDSYILNLLLNGNVFYDPQEGYGFDYSIASQSGYTVRSGLTSITIDTSTFSLTGSPYYLYFREFSPYQELNTFGFALGTSLDSRTVNVGVKDCGGFTFLDNTLLPDPILGDSSTYPSSLPYYYQELTDAGVSSLTPVVRGYFTSPGVTNADFTLDVKYILSAIGVSDYDGGYFTDITDTANDYIYDNNYVYVDEVSPNSYSELSELSGVNEFKSQLTKRNLEGSMFVKNQAYSYSYPLSTALYKIFGKYNSSVKNEIYTGLKDFDVVYDTIVVQSDNYLVFDKIAYEDSNFTTPATKNTYYTKENNINSFSNRFFNEKDKTITFFITETLAALSATNNKVIYPAIYQYNIGDNSTTKIFPKNSEVSSLSSIFSLSGVFSNTFNVNIVKITTPTITYNSFNELYKLTFVGNDNNNLCYIFDYEFDISNNIATFYTSKIYLPEKYINTTNFTSPSTTFTTINSISGSYSIDTSSGAMII